ncbi:MAG: hypothetical protein F6K41_36520, partial [Symploca sp. SIO3E6]|nr:hypothetical protein [Caldora sp. SIO3E6]
SKTAWVNLDEGSEIGRATMYAGIVDLPSGPEGEIDQDTGAYPYQQFLYLAKANQKEYDYVTYDNWNVRGAYDAQKNPNGSQSFATAKSNNLSIIKNQHNYPPIWDTQCPPSSDFLWTHNCVELPNNTIELKSAWRHLNSGEEQTFHTAPVRFYSPTDQNGNVCYNQVDDGWGMAALHIIQKTPSAPYFTFTTFSQIDNIVTEDGSLVENENGVIIANQNLNPTTPTIQSVTPGTPFSDSSIVYEVPAQDQNTNQLFHPHGSQGNPPVGIRPTGTPANHNPTDKSLYYRNTPATEQYGVALAGNLPQFPISVNKRQNQIPEVVAAVNALAHDQIQRYNMANHVQNSPWLNYKLVNVQYKPVDKAPGTRYQTPSNMDEPDAGSYYLSNEVVETDYNLQFFSGKFGPSGTVTDYPSKIDQQNGLGAPGIKGEYWNVFHSNKQYFSGQGFNTGGCIGCHGVAANVGTDFSFILNGAGSDLKPEAVGDTERPLQRFIQLFKSLGLSD